MTSHHLYGCWMDMDYTTRRWATGRWNLSDQGGLPVVSIDATFRNPRDASAPGYRWSISFLAIEGQAAVEACYIIYTSGVNRGG